MVILGGDDPSRAALEKSAVNLSVALTLYSGFDYMLKSSRYLGGPEGS
jgi:hypothetical protein